MAGAPSRVRRVLDSQWGLGSLSDVACGNVGGELGVIGIKATMFGIVRVTVVNSPLTISVG